MHRYLLFTVCVVAALGSWGIPVFGADEAVLKPRVPIDKIEEARTWTNPVPATEENIEKGKGLFPRESLLCDLSRERWQRIWR